MPVKSMYLLCKKKKEKEKASLGHCFSSPILVQWGVHIGKINIVCKSTFECQIEKTLSFYTLGYWICANSDT